MKRVFFALAIGYLVLALIGRAKEAVGINTCGCDPDCWCRRTALGRAVKWWFNGRYFGLHHKNRALAEWKRTQDATP